MSWLREPNAEPIPGYKLLEPLGNGGFGEVWKCEAPGGILKAIKFVFGNLNSVDEDSVKAEQEAKAMEKVKLIRHPFVISLDLIKVVDGELLMVMELADKSLHDLYEDFQKQGRKGIPRELLLGFLSDAAEGLDHMIEKHNLQHLDVKPKNLFLIADRVKVADFGLVRGVDIAGGSGKMGGITPVYAAPETFTGKVSKQADQYSLAIVYYELLTGLKVFNGKNIRQLAMQHMTETPDLTALPEHDRAIVAKALTKTPTERYPSCVAFIRALMGSGIDSSVTISMPSGSRPLSQPNTKRPLLTTMNPSKTNTPLRTVVQANAGSKAMNRPLPRNAPSKNPNGKIEFDPDSGILRPAILIGIGSFGRRALQQIRCRMLDRLGQHSSIPCIRYLHIDCDPDAASRTSDGSSDVALSSEQLFHAPLTPVTNYRRRQLDDIMTWLPREKLYAIPRSMRVDGSRALGRLAFTDHYRRFLTRLKHELTTASAEESLHQSAKFTGLSRQSQNPVVYVFVSASGGTSGMLLDVGHAIRHTLGTMKLDETMINAFILTGAVDDPNSPAEELANVFATLTELNHYADPDTLFQARYGGPEGSVLEGYGLPFDSTYLLPMAARNSDAFRDVTSHLAGYVASELTTQFGMVIEQARRTESGPGRSPFRGFGTFGVWYPQGLLLRSAARQRCIDYVREWSSSPPSMPLEAEKTLQAVLADTRLTPEPVKQFIVSQSTTKPGDDPLQYLASWILDVAKQADNSSKITDPAGWAVGVWDAARDWLGMEPTAESDSAFRRGRLSKTLDLGLKNAYESWDSELTTRIRDLERMSGARLGAAQFVIERLLDTAAAAVETVESQVVNLANSREQAKIAAQEALQAVQSGGSFSLFGNRTGKAIKTLVDKVRSFVDIRVAEDLTNVTSQFYRRLHLRFEDLHRAMRTARERLTKLADIMEMPIVMDGSQHRSNAKASHTEDASQTTLRGSNTMRVVLPHGQDHLDRSAADLLETLPPELHKQLESSLTSSVLEPRGGLSQLCNNSADMAQQLGLPLIDQATSFLSKYLPSEDVTAVEFSAARNNTAEVQRRIGSYIRGAAPLTGGPIDDEQSFLVCPDTHTGKQYADLVRGLSAKVVAVPVTGRGTDLMFCREQPGLRMSDLFQLIDPCWEAYEKLVESPTQNPHSRFDISTWLPMVD